MDNFHISHLHYLQAEHQMLTKYLEKCFRPKELKVYYRKDIEAYEPFVNNLESSRIRLLHACQERLIFQLQQKRSKKIICFIHFFRELYEDLLDAGLPLSANDLAGLIDAILTSSLSRQAELNFERILDLASRHAAQEPLHGNLKEVLFKLLATLEKAPDYYPQRQQRKLQVQLQKLLGTFNPIEKLRSLFPEWKFARRPGKSVDHFPLLKSDPLNAAHVLINEFLLLCEQKQIRHSIANRELSIIQKISGSKEPSIESILECLLIRAVWMEISFFEHQKPLRSLLAHCLIQWHVESEKSLLRILTIALRAEASQINLGLGNDIFQKIKSWAQAEGMTQQLREALSKYSAILANAPASSQRRQLKQETELLLAGSLDGNNVICYHMPELDHLGKFVNELLRHQKNSTRLLWSELLQLCENAGRSKPNVGFLRKCKKLFEQNGQQQFLDVFLKILTQSTNMPLWKNSPEPYLFYPENKESLRALIWASQHLEDEQLQLLLADLAEKCYRRMFGKKAIAASVANAAIYTLGQAKGLSGLTQLSRLKWRIKNHGVTRIIEKQLTAAADIMGISKLEIEDRSVPELGLEIGRFSQVLKDFRAELSFSEANKIQLQFVEQQSERVLEARSKRLSKLRPEIKQLKKRASTIQKNLQAQKERLDRQLILGRCWSFSFFQQYYLNHGLLCQISRKMILEFRRGSKSISGIYSDKGFVDRKGKIIKGINPKTEVTFWHPVFKKASEVQEWQDYIERQEIRQPIKQAHREIYRLTNAERSTGFYSNRMAAHILRQHQFNSLGRNRGWRYSMMGNFDNRESDAISFELPAANIKAEYWVTEVDNTDHMDPNYLWHFISTDQIRFTNLRSMQAMNLEEVPVLVFSELMRDIDLLVAVSSIGNDPNWQDRGGITEHQDYWQSFSFGELSSTARTRKKILQNLIPKLRIAEKCKIVGRFLVVKGKARIYKIHLGSTNILMEPNNEYLCIVSDQSKKSPDVFLPFDGDAQLSLILSKAFLLANDDKITDKTILSQIAK